jgi:photosystem II stability/assembly factor-like uncharacterized protein
MKNVHWLPVAILFAFLFGTLAPAAAQTGWQQQNSGVTDDLNGIDFPQGDTGTAVGHNGTILRTTDGGATWVPQSAGLPELLFDVSFPEGNHGTAVGSSGTILHTRDGGAKWNVVQTGWMLTYYGLHMNSPSSAMAVGQNTIFAPFVTWTADGWNSMSSATFYIMKGSVANEGRLTDVRMLGGGIAFATARVWTGEGAIARTLDGGPTWETIYYGPEALFAIDFPSPDVGFAVGAGGTILRTLDGGTVWAPLSSGVSGDLYAVSFPSTLIGIAAGSGGTVLRTTDGGETWVPQDSGVKDSLNAVAFPDPNTGYIAGDGGLILGTPDGGGASLFADVYSIEAGIGGAANFTLQAGAAHGGRNYLLLGSLSGTKPGLPLPGGQALLPLNWDLFTVLVVGQLNSIVFSNFLGSLDPGGQGSAKFDTLGPIPPALAGAVFHFAYALNNPWDFASVSSPIEVVP